MITTTFSQDETGAPPGALPLNKLEEFLDDIRDSPAWRTRSDLECDYYDGNQHSPEDIARAEDRNLPVVTVNLVAPTVNLIIGMEARTRTDWVVKSDGTGAALTVQQADGLTAKLNEGERNTLADQACADAYASQVKAGIGWIEVSRNTNPFDYRYRVQVVDRKEIWWDMKAKDRLLKDARYLVRKKWQDLDAVLAMVPEEKHQFVKAAVNQPSGWDQTFLSQQFPYLQDNLIGRDWASNDNEWRDTSRQRVCAYEVWYRVWVRGLVIIFNDDGNTTAEYDKTNPMHVAGLATGQARVTIAAYQKVRLSWWVGPFRLLDVPTPYSHNQFPYVPFWGYKEDLTSTPYGVIRSMKSLQDEVNARRARMMWQLSAFRVIAEDDAVDDHKAAAAEVNRADAYIKLAKNRRQRGNAEPFKIEEHEGLNAQQFEVYKDSKVGLQQSAGVYAPMLGDSSSGAEAGVAIDMLIQQGTTTLAGINTNYKYSKTEVGNRLLHMIVEDMHGKQTRVNLPDGAKSGFKSVTFNLPSPTDGDGKLNNDTTKLLWKAALGEVPSNPTYNSQRMKDLVEFAKSLPPELQMVFADMIVMASDLPNREQIAARIRKKTGEIPIVDPATATQEEMAEAEQAQASAQQQAQLQQMATMIEMAGGAAKADKDAAGAQKLVADAELSRATAGLTRAQTIDQLVKARQVEGPKNAEGQSSMDQVDESQIADATQDTFALEQPVQERPVDLGAEMGKVQ